MMVGSFIHAEDIEYSGTLKTSISFDVAMLRNALRRIRDSYFRHRAFYRVLNGEVFGKRLRRLIDSRCNGDFNQFATDIGISPFYIHKLMDEPVPRHNPKRTRRSACSRVS